MFNAGPIEKKNFNFHPSLSFLASLFTMLSASIRLCACGFFFWIGWGLIGMGLVSRGDW